jgi:hypothetical protein
MVPVSNRPYLSNHEASSRLVPCAGQALAKATHDMSRIATSVFRGRSSVLGRSHPLNFNRYTDNIYNKNDRARTGAIWCRASSEAVVAAGPVSRSLELPYGDRTVRELLHRLFYG